MNSYYVTINVVHKTILKDTITGMVNGYLKT